MIQGRDPGDESDALHARIAVTALMPLCPACFSALMPPFVWTYDQPDPRDTAFHPVRCNCGRLVMARFYVEQGQ